MGGGVWWSSFCPSRFPLLEFRSWSINQSIGVYRMRWFLAVLRSPFHSSLSYTFSCHSSPPTILPSSLTSSSHLFLGLPLGLVVPRFIYNTFLGILFSSRLGCQLRLLIPFSKYPTYRIYSRNSRTFLTKILYINLGCMIYVRKRFYLNKSGYTGNFLNIVLKAWITRVNTVYTVYFFCVFLCVMGGLQLLWIITSICMFYL